MRLTHYGHACVALHDDRGTSILIDPGSLAQDLTGVERPNAVLVTHRHEDHLDLEQLGRLAPARDLPVWAPQDSIDDLRLAGFTDVRVLDAGGVEGMPGFEVRAFARPHEVIHAALPLPQNLALLIDDRVYHPGDSLQRPDVPVDVLLLPLGAPWLRLSDIVEFTRDVAPRLVIPIHQGGLAEAHRRLHVGLLTKLAPEGTTVVVPEQGVPLEL